MSQTRLAVRDNQGNTLYAEVDEVVAIRLIGQIVMLNNYGQQWRQLHEEVRRSGSAIPGMVGRLRLASSGTESLTLNSLDLLKTLISSSETWKRTFQKMALREYEIPDYLAEALEIS
jgi:hypothetical protein